MTLRASPRLTLELAERRIFNDENFFLVDVGARGGIAAQWYAFGRDLVAIGFDPLVTEVDRLNRANTHSGIRYYSAYVGYRQYDRLFPAGLRGQKVKTGDNQPFQRTSAARAFAVMKHDSNQRHADPAGTRVTTEDRVELDKFLEREAAYSPDFIKVDTDGSDYEVLLGAEHTLREKPVLGLSIECQFHGPVHAHANLFSNIDILLRSLGFSLFDLEPFCYSRASLPRPFRHPIPAQTVEGQVLWAEGLYLRDLGDPDYETMWPVELTPVRILKMACLFEIHGLEDCAVELLLKYRDRVSSLVDVDGCLDLLTPEFQGRKISYSEYIRGFDQQPAAFFPAQQPDTELRACRLQNRQMAHEIRQLRASWSWRVTAPLRRMVDTLGVFRR
jgi:FkbM family methyltransferase